MKYLKTYEEQLNLFGQEENDKAQDVARNFVKKYKYTNSSTPGELKTAKDVLDKYDTKDTFNRFCKICYNNMDYNDSEIEDIVNEFFKNNKHILSEYVKDYYKNYNGVPDYITDKYQEYLKEGIAKEGDKIEDYFEQIINEYFENEDDVYLYKLQEDGLIYSVYDFEEFVNTVYTDKLDFSILANSEFYDDLIYVIENCEDDEIEIYRGLLIPNKIKDLGDDYSGVGISWTYDEGCARSYVGIYDDNQEIILHGKVKIEDINWETTIYKSIYNLADEREIKVNPGSPIYLMDIHLKDKQDEILKLKEKDYDYFKKVLNINWADISKIRRDADIETKEKTIIRFEEPIKIKS